jgi:hypothetical protein
MNRKTRKRSVRGNNKQTRKKSFYLGAALLISTAIGGCGSHTPKVNDSGPDNGSLIDGSRKDAVKKHVDSGLDTKKPKDAQADQAIADAAQDSNASVDAGVDLKADAPIDSGLDLQDAKITDSISTPDVADAGVDALPDSVADSTSDACVADDSSLMCGGTPIFSDFLTLGQSFDLITDTTTQNVVYQLRLDSVESLDGIMSAKISIIDTCFNTIKNEEIELLATKSITLGSQTIEVTVDKAAAGPAPNDAGAAWGIAKITVVVPCSAGDGGPSDAIQSDTGVNEAGATDAGMNDATSG